MSKNTYSSKFFEGFYSGLTGVSKKVEEQPYENFPFCCSADNSVRSEVNFKKLKSKNAPPLVLIDAPMPAVAKTFWTSPLVQRFSRINSNYSATE